MTDNTRESTDLAELAEQYLEASTRLSIKQVRLVACVDEDDCLLLVRITKHRLLVSLLVGLIAVLWRVASGG